MRKRISIGLPPFILVALGLSGGAVLAAGTAGRPLWPGDVAVATGPQDHGISSTAGAGITALADGAGGTILAWEDDNSGQIHAQHLSAGGTALWAAGGVAIAPTPLTQFQFSPQAATDGHGGAIIAWVDDRNGLCSRSNQANCNVIVQHIDANGQPQWAVGGVAVSPLTGAQTTSGVSNEGTSGIGIGSDGQGGAVVAWEDARNCCTIYAQRVSASGALLWGPAGIQVSPNPTKVIGAIGAPPTVIGDGAGGALIGYINIQVDPLTQVPPVVFQHMNAQGIPQFPGNGIAAIVSYNFQYSVVDSMAGGAIVVVQTPGTDGSPDLQAQRIDLAGNLLWGPQGVPVVAAPNLQQQGQASPDGSGGVLVAWADMRAGGSFDIYAQHLDANGAAVWAQNGIAVTQGVVGEKYPLIVSDGGGGAVVAWQDCRNLVIATDQYACDFGRDLFAQRLSSAGAPLWPANGVPVTTGPFNQGVDYGSQYIPSFVMIGDAAGGAILAWPDGRSVPCPLTIGARDCEVYAQRISDQNGAPPIADLMVTMMAAPGPVQPGTAVTYNIVVKNLGPDTAQSVNLVDTPPIFGSVTNALPSQGGCLLPTVCSLGTLASGQSASVSYTFDPSFSNPIVNSVMAYAAETDPNTANNSASATAGILDFTLDVSPQSQTVPSGSSAAYTITATATLGESLAGLPVLSCMNLPANSRCVSSAATQSGAIGTATLTILTGVAPTAAGSSLPLVFIPLLPFAAMLRSARRRRRTALGLAGVSLAALFTLSACGGGAGGGNVGTPTPSGTYAVTVSVTVGATTHNAPVTLIVQ